MKLMNREERDFAFHGLRRAKDKLRQMKKEKEIPIWVFRAAMQSVEDHESRIAEAFIFSTLHNDMSAFEHALQEWRKTYPHAFRMKIERGTEQDTD